MKVPKINNLIIKILILFGVILGISSVLFRGTLLMLFIVLITGIALWNFLPKCDRRFLLGLFIIGIFLRIVIYSSFYFASEDIAGRGELVPDSRLYTARAVNMARIWSGYPRLPFLVEEQLGQNGYLYILAFFYLLIGYIPHFSTVVIEKLITYSLFSDKLINCLIGTLTGIVIFYITKEIFNKKVAKLVSILVVFFPSLFLWSMTNVRDPINILLAALIILSIIKIQKRAKVKYFILLFLSLSLLYTIRQYAFFPMLIIVLFSLLVSAFHKSKNKILFVLLTVGFLVTFFNFTHYEKILANKFFNFNNIAMRLHDLNRGILSQRGNYYEIYDSDFLIDGKINRLKFLKAFLKGWLYFMLTPFPWSTLSIRQITTYPQIIFWYFLLPFAFAGILFAFRYRLNVSLSLICYILLLTSLFALVEGNIGSAMRHRDLVTPFYLIFSAAGIVNVLGGISPFEKEM